jgi:hypothetical protein
MAGTGQLTQNPTFQEPAGIGDQTRFSLLIAFDKVKAKNQQDRLSDQSSSK